MITTFKLVSLWDMLQLPIGRLFSTFRQLIAFAQMHHIRYEQLISGESNIPLIITDEDYQVVANDAKEFASLCLEASLVVTHEAAKAVCADLKRATKTPDGHWTFNKAAMVHIDQSMLVLSGSMRHETSSKVAMILPPEKLGLYAPAIPMFGPEARNKFPSAIHDIDEAAKCLALGRSTASVFHLMRVTEVLLKAVSKCLGLPEPKNPNWGTWISPIRADCASRNQKSKWPEWDLFQDFWQRIDAIKDAQRNQTMHVETVYTEEEAALIFSCTEAFMKKVASRMDESGLPLA